MVKKMKLSDYVAKFISEKVKEIFTIPGGGCIHLSDSFARQQNINVIANHHEQCSALSAEGYARLNNHIGVCLVTSGPGGSNAWTGTLCSYQDSVPVMVISGNVNKKLTTNYTNLNLRQLGDQEFNVSKTVSNFTKYSVQINNPLEIKYELEKAYHIATTGRKGPVWIDIPLDVQSSEIDLNTLKGYTPNDDDTHHINDDILHDFLNKLSKAKKPLIIAGYGVRLSGSVDLLDRILEKYNIPVITSFNGNDSVSNEYKYYCGRFGTHAQIAANTLLKESDFILALGSRLYVRQIGYNFKNFAPNAFKAYVDIDKNELEKPTIFPDLKINTDVKYFLQTIEKNIKITDINKWREHCKNLFKDTPKILEHHKNSKELSVYNFVNTLNNYLNAEIPIVTSDGSANIVGMQILNLKKNQRLFSNKGTAPMGYGMPAAIGACFSNNKNKIICLEGDGSLHMNIHELQVIVQHKLPIKLFVINNNGYLSIKITQEAICNGLLSLSDPSSGLTLPSYEKLSNAYGIKYSSIKNPSDFSKISSIINSDLPEFVEVFVKPFEYHEPRVKVKMDENGNFLPGELHDIQWIKN